MIDSNYRSDAEHLESITQEVYAYLRSVGAPPTARNIVHAMFNLHYADWLCGEQSVRPICPMENSQGNGL